MGRVNGLFRSRAAALLLTAVLPSLPSCQRAANVVTPQAVIEKRSFQRDLPGCGDKTKREQPCLTFNANWIEVKSGATPEVLQKINAKIRAFLHPAAVAAPDFEEEANAFVEAYQKLKSEYPEMSQVWFDRRSAEVLLNDGKLLSVAVDRKFFQGGPFAEESTRLMTFRLSDGAVVTLNDLLIPAEARRFGRLAERRLRLDRGIQRDDPLPDYAIFAEHDTYRQTQDVAALPKGVQIHFDPGQIASSAVGSIDILLTWEELAPVLRPGGPFAHLAGR